MFCLLVGIGFGTYSSIFIASATAYDFLKGRGKDKDEKLSGKTSVDAVIEK